MEANIVDANAAPVVDVFSGLTDFDLGAGGCGLKAELEFLPVVLGGSVLALIVIPEALADAIDEDFEAINAGIKAGPSGVADLECVVLTGDGLELFVDAGAIGETIDRILIELNELHAGDGLALIVGRVLELNGTSSGLPPLTVSTQPSTKVPMLLVSQAAPSKSVLS